MNGLCYNERNMEMIEIAIFCGNIEQLGSEKMSFHISHNELNSRKYYHSIRYIVNSFPFGVHLRIAYGDFKSGTKPPFIFLKRELSLI